MGVGRARPSSRNLNLDGHVDPKNLEQNSSNFVLALLKDLSIPGVPCNTLRCWLMLRNLRTDRVMHQYVLACILLPAAHLQMGPSGQLNRTPANNQVGRHKSARHITDCQQH
ncbi:hypothetical protein FIBSPDRAFT_56160 [Athelia psychrophila]|uniref:Uncharacterized protein n=1 Tax=Athelia psychrophila TaxID=1759441 RepID=A0A166FA30_9AGAM|nr:hypothetical protein FIBSPDRAFT_56160 [Fibularhizoctonia sp. CBS 109695]